MNFNRTLVLGNLARDPEGKTVGDNLYICKFTVGVNRRTRSGSEVSFLNVVAWGENGKECIEKLKKGTPVFIEGYLKQNTWTDQEGKKKSSIEIVAENLIFNPSGHEFEKDIQTGI